MVIGVPKEIKDGEERVAITPAGVASFREQGHTVLVEGHAGAGSRIPDSEYRQAGARIVRDAAGVFGSAELILKVKEPLSPEYRLLHQGHILFTYLHLASSQDLTRALLRSGLTAIAYETVETDDGRLPLLVPMSEIAGKMSVQIGARLLETHSGGRGTLLGGVPGVPPADVVILGGGVSGARAARVAAGMGARVTVLDVNHERLRYLSDVLPGNVQTLYSSAHGVDRAARYADLVIGAVLVPGAKAPKLVRRETVRKMKAGAVIVDIAIDQGGCVETIRPTCHSRPSYLLHDVVHYAVPNIPAAVARTSTNALTNATLPWALEIANKGVREALASNRALTRGLNVAQGRITHPAVAHSFGVDAVDWRGVLV